MFLLLLAAQIPASGRVESSELFLYGTGWAFGSSVAACGDVNGDDVPDFAVGAPRGAGNPAGQVQLFSGADGSELARWTGDRDGGLFGFRLVAADLDGDGAEELLVAELGPEGGRGAVVVLDPRDAAEFLRLEGWDEADDFGWSLAAGDVTGDGRAEIAVGAPSAAEGKGAAYVFSGTGAFVAKLAGEAAGDRFGWSLDAGADFDGDCAGDLVVGAPRRGGSGAVFVRSIARDVQLARLDGQSEGEAFGFSVASLRDADGDRKPDLAVGAPWREGGHPGAGAVDLHAGSDWQRLWELKGYPCAGGSRHEAIPTAWDCMGFGHLVVGLPDQDGDGRSDVAVSAPKAYSAHGSPKGNVLVVSGSSGVCLGRHSGQSSAGAFGAAIDLVEIDRRTTVLLVGAPGEGLDLRSAVSAIRARDGQSRGCVEEVVSGPARCSFLGLAPGLPQTGRVERADFYPYPGTPRHWPFGSAVVVLDDLDGGGTAEFAIAEPRSRFANARRGRVRLYSGESREVLHAWSGARDDEHFGMALAGGDVDGDGTADLVVGAPGRAGGLGRVAAFSGATYELRAEFASGVRGDDFGWSVAVADVDGDGRVEVIVGAPSDGLGTGAVRVFEATGELRAEFRGREPGDRFGWSLASGADFDGDGADDLAIGAPGARGQGAVSVYSVREELELSRLFGGRRGDQFGFSLAIVPHPLLPRLAVGSPGRDGAHEDEGAVTLFFHGGAEAEVQWSGCSATPASRFDERTIGRVEVPSLRTLPEPDARHSGCQDGMRFGHALVGLPAVSGQPLSGDRNSRIAVSAPRGYSCFGASTGWVTVLRISADRVDSRVCGSGASSYFGSCLAACPRTESGPMLLIGAPDDGVFSGGMVDVLHEGERRARRLVD